MIVHSTENLHHHHHHVMLLARIPLTISRHSSLLSIAPSGSSRLLPVPAKSCCRWVLAGRPTFARPCEEVNWNTSLMCSSLLLQQFPVCLVRLIWMVFVMSGRWPYCCFFVRCCLFIICLDYVPRTSIELMKENCFMLAKERSRRYSARSITDSDYAVDLAHQANIPTLPGSQGSRWHGLSYVNADKTECMYFNQRGDISKLKDGTLKLVDKFTYLGSSISSTEKDIKTWLAKAWTATDRLSVIWK